jgi:hypothetical protein
MNSPLLEEFNKSGQSLRIYAGEKLIFSSNKDRVLPLLEYISRYERKPVVLFDKVMGNAAALLAAKAGCVEVYSPLGSQLAVKTLDEFSIKYHITQIMPFILRPDGADICPMEKLSMGKEPEEFYQLMCARLMPKT